MAERDCFIGARGNRARCFLPDAAAAAATRLFLPGAGSCLARFPWLKALGVLVVSACFVCAASRESILRFDSHIVVQPSGTLTVVETIQCSALGKKIKRGLYRELPTRYRGPFLTKVVVPLRIKKVLRDGNPEPFHIEDTLDGVRIYIGDPQHLLKPGRYTYQIEYETDGQIGFFSDHDELYWNVTGTGWDFPLEQVSATVVLPQGVRPATIKPEAFTGKAGSRGEDYRASVDSQRSVAHFETTRALAPREGLTIVVSFPKGILPEPSASERRAAFFRANRELVVAAIGMVALLTYYLLAWLLLGRDPEEGSILPQASPPMGLSPACLRYIRRMGFDQKCFSATLLSLAVKGYIRIEQKKARYDLVRQEGKHRPLSTDEKLVARHLLKSDRVALDQANSKKIRKAVKALKRTLRVSYEGSQFQANRGWLIPGIILGLLVLVSFPLLGQGSMMVVGFVTVWLTIWTIGVYALTSSTLSSWSQALGHVRQGKGFWRLGPALFLTLFTLPFLGGEVMGFWFLVQGSSFWIVPALLCVVAINLLFFEWLKRPTGSGRKLMDQIEGFRLYLAGSHMGPRTLEPTNPSSSVDLYEQYFPYAFALDMENEWGQHFDEALQTASVPARRGTTPLWYSGDHFHGTPDSHSWSSLGSGLTSALASASAPGSTSGSSGGGSSGGGGGGGGGGGW